VAVGDDGDVGMVVTWGGGARCRGWWLEERAC